MQTKFKTGINAILTAFIVVYHIVILLLLSSKIFVTTNVGVIFGIVLLVVDAALILPMLFLTDYELKEDYMVIRDWPFKRYKIPYDAIFDIKDEDFETKNKHTVALSYNRVAIAYREPQKDGTEKEMYIFISPAEMSLFLVRMSGKLKQSELQLKKRAKEMSEAQLEHDKKKKIAKQKKDEMKQQREPEIIVEKEIKKFSGFSEEDAEEK